jgi:cell wall-associated NlpC family hydrolase
MPNNKKNELVAQITARARTWLGTPFRHQGRRKDGCDCIAIPFDLCVMLGIPVVDWKRYGRLPSGHKLYETFLEHAIEIDKTAFAPGDLLLMTWKKEPHHTALVVKMADGNIGIIHSHSNVGRVVEHILDTKWRQRIVHVFRFRQIKELS